MELLYGWVTDVQIHLTLLLSQLLSTEVPFALPPTRFADPVPLPEGWKYEEGKEYLTESKCGVTMSIAGSGETDLVE